MRLSSSPTDDVMTRPLPLLLLLGIALALTTAACSGELDPSEPEDAYEMFRNALLDGDGAAVWERTDEHTRLYFQERYASLQEMDDLIERYLPPVDHQLARSQSGSELLDELESPEELFTHIFQFEDMADDAIRLGSDPRQIQLTEDETSAVVLTRTEQEFVLVLQDDEQWYVNLVESGDFVDEAFAWLDQNEDALEQTVEDLIAEEQQLRESIIADLLNRDE